MAFDTVPHDDLIRKLKIFGLEDNSLEWLTSYLTNRTQAVCVKDELSSPMPVLNGVPQGSILGPVMFTLFINDLPSCIQFSNIMMYADDTVIYLSSTSTVDSEHNLNLDLAYLSQWLHYNKLVINMKKTEFMTFDTRQRLARLKCDETEIRLNGQSIRNTDTFKYLGVVLDGTLSFNDHVDYARIKISKILGSYRKLLTSLLKSADHDKDNDYVNQIPTPDYVVETSVTATDNSPSQDYTHPDDQTTPSHVTPGFKPFTALRSLGRQSERLANDYITYASTVRRIRQQLWFNHRCKDHGLVPAGLKLKPPLNTQEAIQIVKATCRRLVKARINDCHRRLKHHRNKLRQLHDQLKQLIPTDLLDTVTTIADKRANKTTERARTGHQQKLTRLLRDKEERRSKPDDNWVSNISSRSLDKTETRVLSYGLKHSVTPKRIPTEAIVSSVEAALSRQRELSEPTKDNIRSRIASTIQSTSLHDSNLTKDEQRALKRLRNDENIVILPADKGRVTVVMDKTDYHDKMDALVNDKRTYEELKRDPTPALQRKLNSKLLTLKKTNAFDNQRYYRLRCSVPQPPKLYGLPKLHKPGFPMRPIVSFCGSPTYQLSKYLTTILQPLTDKSRHELQSTEDFINATETVQISDDYKVVLLDFKITVHKFTTLKTVTRHCHGVSNFCFYSRDCDAEHRGTRSFHFPTNDTALVTLR
ncbi:RNA-directed DNA polymerase from mobile element jockey [Stylophora pistillata]|uniref:RNA-directed DNA polymerase from mobile element jockey n=1 Tax=Stylophora pistillata TaxID=50429 RepID=A0A2B4R9X2_STYPI|nr:RNA-directed DNA polymerase from mobile element jockey [Stylophora pistillata]